MPEQPGYDMPVISEKNARAIFAETRAFFKGDVKSANKLYGVGQDGEWRDAARAPNADEANRAAQQAIADSLVSESRDRLEQEQLTHFAYGFRILRAEQGRRAGNCFEMACVAMAIAYVKYDVKLEWLFIASIRDPGDHAFLIVNDVRPTWATIPDLTAGGSEAWAIDPWANTVCKGDAYEAAFLDKMGQWAQQGKRIYYVTRRRLFRGWAEPTMPRYIAGFRQGPMDYAGAV